MSAALDFDLQRAAVLRMLIYPIQFEADPLNGINRVLAQGLSDLGYIIVVTLIMWEPECGQPYIHATE
jgi:hypothetical protein